MKKKRLRTKGALKKPEAAMPNMSPESNVRTIELECTVTGDVHEKGEAVRSDNLCS